MSTIYGALVSKSSLEPVAEMGLDLMCTGGTSVATMTENCDVFNNARARVGLGPTRPIIAAPGYCAPTLEAAMEVADRAFGGYIEGSRRHYGFDNPQQFADIKGYQQYAPGGGGDPRGDSPREDYLRSGIFGTPNNASRRSECMRRSPVRTTSSCCTPSPECRCRRRRAVCACSPARSCRSYAKKQVKSSERADRVATCRRSPDHPDDTVGYLAGEELQ